MIIHLALAGELELMGHVSCLNSKKDLISTASRFGCGLSKSNF
jgi:hypothetical protein